MPWSIPDDGEALASVQSVVFQEYLEALVEGIAGTNCILAGGAVTVNALLVLNVAKASILSNGILRPVTAGTVTIAAADVTNPRFDLVVADSTGAKQVRTGTANAAPKPPARTANDVLLAVIYVPAATTEIAANQIVDLRVLRTVGPIVVNKVTTPIVFSNTSAIQTYYSLVLPAGLLVTGRILELKLAGDMLMNNGTPTITLTISFGGTVIFADVSGAATAGTPRKPWKLHMNITAHANNDQEYTGFVMFPALAALTAPATGLGDIALTTAQVNAISGIETAIDADAADRTLLVQMTMSVANAANDIRLESAVAELL